MQTETKTYTVDSEIAPKLLEWFRSGRGVRCWTNAEIASGASQEVFTPNTTEDGQPMPSPNWRYPVADSEQVSIVQLLVSVFDVKQEYNSQLKNNYYGQTLRGEAKAKRLADKLGKNGSFRWYNKGYGVAGVEIGTERTIGFNEWISEFASLL